MYVLVLVLTLIRRWVDIDCHLSDLTKLFMQSMGRDI